MLTAEELKRKYPHFKDLIAKDGSLFSLGWYLDWTAGSSYATLDGDFSADDLIEIATYIKEQS